MNGLGCLLVLPKRITMHLNKKRARQTSSLMDKSGQASGIRALKRGLGDATEGKWKKINRRIKTLMRQQYITEST